MSTPQHLNILLLLNKIIDMRHLQSGVAHALRSFSQMYTTLVRRVVDYLVVIDNNSELLRRDAAEHTCTNNEVHRHTLREGAQHFALRHIDSRDWHLDILLSEDIG